MYPKEVLFRIPQSGRSHFTSMKRSNKVNTPSMNRRDFLQLAAAATVGTGALGGLLAACGGPASTSKGTVTLAYWDWWQSQAPWVDNEIKLFQQANPSIKIKKTTQMFNNYHYLFALAAKSSKLPHAAMITVVTPPLPTPTANASY